MTSENLVLTYLARIDETNPTYHAVTEVNQHALQEARELDRELQKTGPRSRLHGIPILVKDSLSVDGLQNTAGSKCLVGATTKESSVITRLRKAGAIILGKSNMSEWGNCRSSVQTASNGWSATGNQTLGIYHARQDPCGSSSGSAVAVALGLSAAAVGVETVGSITCPAMRSNLVSIKTTSGLVARDNVIVAQSRGSVGPITHSVKDSAIMLSIMAGPNADDPLSTKIPFEEIPDYAASCTPGSLRGSRLAIPRNAILNPIARDMNTVPVIEIFNSFLQQLNDAGATIIDPVNYTAYDQVNSKDAPQSIFGPAEYKRDTEDYLKSLETNPRNIQTMEDLIACTKELDSEEYPSRDVAVLEAARDADEFESPRVTAAWEKMQYLGGPGGIDGVLDSAGADAIIYPSVCSSDVPGLVGYPVVCVPLGFMPKNTPIQTNSRGDLISEGPGIP